MRTAAPSRRVLIALAVPVSVVALAACGSSSGGSSSASPTATSSSASPTASPTASGVTKQLLDTSTAMIGTQTPLNVSKGTLTTISAADSQEMVVSATGKSGDPDWELRLTLKGSEATAGTLTSPGQSWTVVGPSGTIVTEALNSGAFSVVTEEPIDVKNSSGAANTLSLNLSVS